MKKVILTMLALCGALCMQAETQPKLVDMGLSVKWADRNLGATSPTDDGTYLAWGEMEAKSTYSNSTYTYRSNPAQLEASHDAVSVKLGNGMRMPTLKEFTELVNGAEWSWERRTTSTGDSVCGFCVKSRTNGNAIFLPASGYYDGNALNFHSEYGCYWTSTIFSADNTCADILYFNLGNQRTGESPRWRGYTIRPVAD